MKGYDYFDISSFVEELMAKKESAEIEFKSAAGGFPKSFWETYSSFANTNGGTIVLGIKEKKGFFYVDNLTDELVEKYQKEFWSGVNNRDIVNRNLLSNDDVVIGELDNHKVLLFYIPRAAREQRPIYYSPNPYNGTYKRNFEGDFKCTEQEVRRMYADANVSISADSRILDNYTFDDIDRTSLDQYRRLFDLAKPGHAWLALDDVGLLKKLGGYKVDRTTGREGFTLAGLLMFGKTESITDESCAPYFFPDYRELGESDFSPRWIDRIYPDGTWEANLFQYYRRILPKLQEILPTPFQLEGDMRKEETPAHVAVREALINTLIHADYTINASTVITRSKNELVFSNPGSMLVSKLQYYEGGDSVCRNQSLQKMFMMLGRAEKAGSGADKIISGWKESNWYLPNLEERTRPDKVVLTLPLISILDDKIKNELVKIFGENILSIDHNKLITLALTVTEGVISNERLRYSLNMHKYDITRMLKELCNEGYLISNGIGRGTTYQLNVKEGDVNMATSDANMATSSYRKRLPKIQLQALIADICSDWKTLEDVAGEVGRDAKYLRGNIIPEMLKIGMIEMQFPKIPNHPGQKYKKIE